MSIVFTIYLVYPYSIYSARPLYLECYMYMYALEPLIITTTAITKTIIIAITIKIFIYSASILMFKGSLQYQPKSKTS